MENDKTSQTPGSNRSLSDSLHPLVYKAMVGLALWFIFACWGFFDDRGYIFLALSVVTWLVIVVVVITSVLARIGRDRGDRHRRRELPTPPSFHDWVHGDFGLSEGRLKCSAAAIEIFVPIMAAAIGMTLFAIVRDLVVS